MSILNKKATAVLTTILTELHSSENQDLLKQSSLLSHFNSVDQALHFACTADDRVASFAYEICRLTHIANNSKLLNKYESFWYNLPERIKSYFVDLKSCYAQYNTSLLVIDSTSGETMHIASPADMQKCMVPYDQLPKDKSRVFVYTTSDSEVHYVSENTVKPDTKFVVINIEANKAKQIFSFINKNINNNIFASGNANIKEFATSVLNGTVFDDCEHMTIRHNRVLNNFVNDLICLAINSLGNNEFVVFHCPVKGMVWAIPVSFNTETGKVQYCALYMDQLALNWITGDSLKDKLYANPNSYNKIHPITVHDVQDMITKFKTYREMYS